MSETWNYLSDEELEALIGEVEENELVSAPPDLKQSVLEQLGLLEVKEKAGEKTEDISLADEQKTVEKPPEIQKVMEKRTDRKRLTRRDYYGYCFRVITSVAAAVALVFLLPEALGNMEMRPKPEREKIVLTSRYETKEDALSDNGFLSKSLGGSNIFSYETKWNIFEKLNGGF